MLATDTEVYSPVVIGREEFASAYFHYEPGQKVVFAGKSQESGKTTLAFKLLEYCATPKLPAYVIVSKARDPVTMREGKRLGFRFVDHWPAEPHVKHVFNDGPPGYIIQASYGDIERDREKATQVARAVLTDRYKAGAKGKPSIVVIDDTVVVSKLFRLDREMTTHIALGGAMDVGGWYFVQKPTGSGDAVIWAFENSEHTFLAKPKDARVTERFGEISGFDRKLIAACLAQLQQFQFLYVSGAGYMCIVDSK